MIYLGLDLGKAGDYTAVAAVEAVRERLEQNTPEGKPQFGAFLNCLHLHRYDLNTAYTVICQDVAAMTDHKAIKDRGYLLIPDATGVGMAVVDLLRLYKLKMMPVEIIGQGKEIFDKDTGYWHIPKRDLMSNLVIAFETSQIRFADKLVYKGLINNELMNFRMKKPARSVNDTFEAREGEHDDLVLALALAVIFARRHWFLENTEQKREPHPLTKMRYL